MVTGRGFPLATFRIAPSVAAPLTFPQSVIDRTSPGLPLSIPGVRWTTLNALALDTARNQELFDISGNIIWTGNASANTANVEIFFDDVTNGPVPLLPGVAMTQNFFSKFYMTHTAQSGETLTIVIGTDLLRQIEIET